MSIVALKRKTLAKYNNNSVNSPDGFSLNGTHRNQGYVGQTSLSRSLPRTPMKGNVAKGHGGCCGKYYNGPIVASAVSTLEDSGVVKSSVLSSPGMIRTKYRWIRRPQPYSSTKPLASQGLTQADYIEYLRQKSLTEKNADGSPCHVEKTVKPFYKKCGNLSGNQAPTLCPESVVTATPAKTGALDSSEYTFGIIQKCIDIEEYKPTTYVRRTPFSCPNSTFK